MSKEIRYDPRQHKRGWPYVSQYKGYSKEQIEQFRRYDLDHLNSIAALALAESANEKSTTSGLVETEQPVSIALKSIDMAEQKVDSKSLLDQNHLAA
jgi:hypothetical protein